jgi:hypothetical protein
MKLPRLCAILVFCLITARDASAEVRRLGGGHGYAASLTDLSAFERTDLWVKNISANNATWYIPLVDDGAIALSELYVTLHVGDISQPPIGCTYVAGDSMTGALYYSINLELENGYLMTDQFSAHSPLNHGIYCTLPPSSENYIVNTSYSW